MDVRFYQEQVLGSPPCWQLVTHVYMRERGLMLENYRSASRSIRDIAEAFRMELHRGEHRFQQLAAPVDLAVVLMGNRPKFGAHHCGIFWQGSVLHALDSGTLYQDMNTLRAQYPLMEFWSREA